MHDFMPPLLMALIAFGIFHVLRIQERQQHIESKLDALLKHLGVEWGKHSEPSERVKALARDPATHIEAIKAYREQTGLGLKEAKDVVDGLAKRSTSEG